MRDAALLLAAASGCSLLIPLDDYVGKPSSSAAGSTSTAGTDPMNPMGGTTSGGSDSGGSGAARGGSGGMGGEGGAGAEGGEKGGDAGFAGAEAGAESGGRGGGGGGGTGGDQGGRAGAGMSGTNNSGTAGDAGTAGTSGSGNASGRGGDGGGGAGGIAGVSGGGMAGAGGCPEIDLTSDPEHCGSCEHACIPGAECIDSTCVSEPCDGLCASAVDLPLKPNDGYRADDIQVDPTCFQVKSYDPAPNLPSLVCWNFATGRTVAVNGVTVPCLVEPGAGLMMKRRAGGYCIQASAGDWAWAGVKLPLPSPLKPPP